MAQASPIGRPVTNEDILAELKDWNGDQEKVWQAIHDLQGRLAALEASLR